VKPDAPEVLRAQITVHEAGDGDAADWRAFVAAHPRATFFHRWEWRSLLAAHWRHRPHFLLARRGAEVVGVLPLAHVKSLLFGSSLVSLPFCVYGGPVTDDPEALAALDARALQIAERERVGHLEYRTTGRLHPQWPSSELYYTFRKAISRDDEANMAAIPRKQRAMVRKGIANGLTAAAEDVDAFFPIYSDNVHRHGTPGLPRSWFRALRDAFGDDFSTLVVRDPAGQALSVVATFWFRDEALPYYAGDVEAARGLAANDFKYWRLMCEAAARGCVTFDYGRSKAGTGPFAFKKNWGFEPTPLPYEYRLLARDGVPQNNPLNPKYRLMIETWRRLPRPLVEWLGPRVVRALG
jgi:FemAB-related protein (PEP-CTERM system-associated)